MFIGFTKGGVNTAKEAGEFGHWGFLSSIFTMCQHINCLASFVASCPDTRTTGCALPLKNLEAKYLEVGEWRSDLVLGGKHDFAPLQSLLSVVSFGNDFFRPLPPPVIFSWQGSETL